MSEEEFSLSDEPSVQILFYPISFCGNGMNGIGIGDHISSQAYIVTKADFYLLKFFTPEIFFFQMKSDRLDIFKRYSKCDAFVFFNEKFRNYLDLNPKNRFDGCIDNYTRKPNPLKHIITKSRKMEEREKKCIFLAMDFGFPLINIVNIRQNAILRFRDKILNLWDKIIQSQHGTLEHDFMSTLRRGINAIKKEYSGLFIELDRISGENHLLPTEPLFSFLNVLSDISPLSHFSPPKIFFDQVSIKGIFDLDRESASTYSKVLSSEFKKRKHPAEVRYNIITKSKRKDGYRIRFLIDLRFPKYMELSHAKWELKELRDIILSELKKVDPEAYEIFQKSKLEIWLKKVRVNIVIQKSYEKETKYLTKKFFKGTLDHKSVICESISKDQVKIRFGLSFDKVSDYSISEIDDFYDISDKYTRLAIEKIYRGNFSEAFVYLQRAKNALQGDLYMIESKETASDEFLKKALICYKKAGVSDSIISGGYLSTEYKDRIQTALEMNSDWMISLRLYLKARDLEKDISSPESLGSKEMESKMWLEKLYKRYSGLNAEKRLSSFIEEIGNFYSLLLVNIQRKHGIPPREVLGFDF
ncbi:MAG: hypothetical protein AYK18_15160 [Theionarchaea archaeon DG-70]|nr:MAG: hypothetical protein AYK18_15160 [Theionarchaea archaeon DG-70]